MRKTNPLEVGNYIDLEGETMLIVNIRFDIRQVELLAKHNQITFLDMGTFYDKIAKGDIKLPGFSPEKSSRAWSSKELEEAHYRLDLLGHLRDQEGNNLCAVEAHEKLVQFCSKYQKKLPTAKTIRAYKKSYNVNGFEGLIPDFSKRGGNGWATKRESKALAAVLIRTHYLQDDKVNLANLARVVQNALIHHPENTLPNLDRKTISTMVLQLPKSMLKGGRMDPRTFNLWNRQAVKPFSVDRAFELMQIDATTVSAYVIDEVGNTHTEATLYSMICTHTDFPVAVYVTAGKPSEYTLLKLFEFLFMPKDDEFHERFGLKVRWPPPSGISAVLLDNATENAAGVALEIVRELGIDVHYARAFRGDDKPHVESSFNTFKKQLLHFIPGSQVSAVKAEKNRHKKAEAEACYRIEDLFKEVVSFIGNVYVHQPLPRLGFRYGEAASIYTAMQAELNKFMPPPPPSVEVVRNLILHKHKATRRVHTYGIQFKQFKYNSHEFARYASEFNLNTIEIMYNPGDCQRIFAVKSEDRSLIELHLKMKDVPAVSFETVELMRKAFGKNPESMTGHDFQRIYAESLLRYSSESLTTSQKVKERNKVRRQSEQKKHHTEVGQILSSKIAPSLKTGFPSPSVQDDEDEFVPAPRSEMPR